MLMTLTFVVLLLAANGFFVAAEFALVKVKPIRLEQLSLAGDRSAKRALHVLRHLEIHLAACQLGITMASLGLGWIGEPFVAALLTPLFEMAGLPQEQLHVVSFALGFLIFSSLHIVVGEQVPKTLALRKAELTSRVIVWPLIAFFWLAWPLTVSLNWLSRTVLRLMGVPESDHGGAHTGAELRSLVGVAHRHGLLKARKAEMLDRMFEFDVRTVAEVMTPRATAVALDVTRDADGNRAVMLEHGHSRYPLINGQDNTVLGIIVVKDFYDAFLRGDADSWRELLRFKRDAVFVPEFARVDRLLERMRKDRSHMAIVIDEYGEFSGIVTLEDLVEEIVGEIDDEFDDSDTTIRQVDNSWEVDGIRPLHEVMNETGLDFADTADVHTLSGLLMQQLGRLPKAGDRIKVNHLMLEVVDMIGTRVGTVRIILDTQGR